MVIQDLYIVCITGSLMYRVTVL